MTPTQDAAIRRAVRELRTELGDSQAKFATRFNRTLNTAWQWECLRAPRGANLLHLAKAAAARRPDLEERFLLALMGEMEKDFEITAAEWSRLAALAKSRQATAKP